MGCEFDGEHLPGVDLDDCGRSKATACGLPPCRVTESSPADRGCGRHSPGSAVRHALPTKRRPCVRPVRPLVTSWHGAVRAAAPVPAAHGSQGPRRAALSWFATHRCEHLLRGNRLRIVNVAMGCWREKRLHQGAPASPRRAIDENRMLAMRTKADHPKRPMSGKPRPSRVVRGRRLTDELKMVTATLEQPLIEKILTRLGLQARARPHLVEPAPRATRDAGDAGTLKPRSRGHRSLRCKSSGAGGLAHCRGARPTPTVDAPAWSGRPSPAVR